MRKKKRQRSWDIPMVIIIAYLVGGLVALFVLPDGITEFGWLRIQTGLFGAVSALAADSQRVSFFLMWMVISFFPTLFLFSSFAPVKLKPGTRSTMQTYMVLIIGFVLFGLISSSYLVHYIVMGDISGNSTLRLGRLAFDMAQDDVSLFFGASVLLVVTMMTIWLSFIAIPVAVYKIIKLPKNTHH